MLLGPTALVASCLVVVVCFATPDAAGARTPANPHIGPHVRGADSRTDALIARGIRRSPTFAKLVEHLNGSDVVVYISTSGNLPAGIEGRLTFMTAAGSVRYLRAEIAEGLAFDDAIGVAGHELQHALEVAAHEEVRDANGLRTLYERIGERSHVHNRFDTEAARKTGRRVRQELG